MARAGLPPAEKEKQAMQAQRTVRLVPVRFIVMAFALLVALLLASAAGYIIRGGTQSISSGATPATLHVQQMSDNQMERAQEAPRVGNLEDGYGVGR
ncbi:MAG: hypothetical protein NVS1B3_11940 [Candidatus Dormibacteraceae bacterium]